MKKANAQNSRPNKSQVVTEFLKGLLAQGPVGVPEIEDKGSWTPGQNAIDHAVEAVSGGEEGPWHSLDSDWLCNRRQVVLAFATRRGAEFRGLASLENFSSSDYRRFRDETDGLGHFFAPAPRRIECRLRARSDPFIVSEH